MKIVSQKEQTSKRNASQVNKQSQSLGLDAAKANKRDASQLNEPRSEDLDSDVAKAESGQQFGLACKLVHREMINMF